MSPVTWLDLSSSQAPCHQWRSSTARSQVTPSHRSLAKLRPLGFQWSSPNAGRQQLGGASVFGLIDWLIIVCSKSREKRSRDLLRALKTGDTHLHLEINQCPSHDEATSTWPAVVTILSNVNLIETTRVSPTTLHSCCLHRDHYCKIEFLSTR